MDLVTALVLLIASVVISAALTPSQQPPKPAAYDEFDFPQAEEGTPQAVTFGDSWSEDWMVLTYGNYRATSIEGDGGKK